MARARVPWIQSFRLSGDLGEFSRSTALYYASILTRYPLAFLFHWLSECSRFILDFPISFDRLVLILSLIAF